MTERGYGKRTAVKQFRITGRNVQGVIALRITDKTGPMAAAVVTSSDVEEVMVGSAKAMVVRMNINEIQTIGRVAQGVKVMTKLQDDDKVISLSAFKEGAGQTETPAVSQFMPLRKNGHKTPSVSQQLPLDVDIEEDQDIFDEDEGAPEGDEESQQ